MAEAVETEILEQPLILVDDEEVQDVNEPLEVIPYRYTITSFGADFAVDMLVKRLDTGDIIIPTFDGTAAEDTKIGRFQRQFVWTKPQMDKFIESLLLGLPVPGIFLVNESNNVMLVLDGQQRLRTLQQFYSGITGGREYRLANVQDEFRGKRYKDLDDEDRRRLDNSIIHATIVRQDQPSDDQSSIYQLFERLNTGGTILQPQEIRVALFRGSLISLLGKLNENDDWRALYGPPSKRLKDQELILRFFAFYYMGHEYGRPLKEFLNSYVGLNRSLKLQDEATLTKMLGVTCGTILQSIGTRAFRPTGPINAAVVDSLMVGIARRCDKGQIRDRAALAEKYRELISNDDYKKLIESSTAQEDNVRSRMEMATDAFTNVA